MTARVLLALSTLFTLIFNDVYKLMPKYNTDRLKENAYGFENINIFFHFENISIPYFTSIIVLILVIIGFAPRFICFFHSIISYSVFYTMLVQEGGDQINVILTLLLIPYCIENNKINGWKYIPTYLNKSIYQKFVAYSIFAIKIQMAVLYFNAGVSKIFQTEWFNGTAVYYWFNNSVFGAPLFIREFAGVLFTNSISVTFINWGVIFLEILLFSALFLNQKIKSILFILALTFHLFIFIIHGLPTFLLSMLAGLIIYLFDDEVSLKKNFYNGFNSIKYYLKHAV